ncbi:MAG: transposase [Sphingobacteriales bacterium]|nr:transposase [Sphingobacteriales bacterium]
MSKYENQTQRRKRKRKHSLREIFNALFYLLKTLPMAHAAVHFPSWKLVYYYFTKWKKDGTIEPP